MSLGKLALAEPVETFFSHQTLLNQIRILPITLPHVSYVAELPFHHRDPFDRLMIAQSLLEPFPIISADALFDPYGVQRLW